MFLILSRGHDSHNRNFQSWDERLQFDEIPDLR
jgi:hypothetical protein